MKKVLGKKFLISVLFFLFPVLIISFVLNMMLTNIWNLKQPTNVLLLGIAFGIVTIISWLVFKLIVSDTSVATDGERKKFNLLETAGIIGTIFIVFNNYSYTPTYGIIITICILFLIQIVSAYFAIKEAIITSIFANDRIDCANSSKF